MLRRLSNSQYRLSFFHRNLRWRFRLNFGVCEDPSYLQKSAKPWKINCLYIAKMLTEIFDIGEWGTFADSREIPDFFMQISGTAEREAIFNLGN